MGVREWKHGVKGMWGIGMETGYQNTGVWERGVSEWVWEQGIRMETWGMGSWGMGMETWGIRTRGMELKHEI